MNNQSPAGKRYMRRFVPTMTAYVVFILGSTWIQRHWYPEGPWLVLLAILPALPIIGIIGVMGLYLLEETDEYQRQTIVAAMLGGLAMMLSFASAWGFLEEAGVVPHLPAYYAFIVWCACWGMIQCGTRLRERLRGREGAHE
jgi:hypothetical protein